jgi:hemerythrin-like metal-binding protein
MSLKKAVTSLLLPTLIFSTLLSIVVIFSSQDFISKMILYKNDIFIPLLVLTITSAVGLFKFSVDRIGSITSKLLSLESDISDLAGTSDQIQNSSENISASTIEQSSSLQEVASSITEISAMVTNNSSSVSDALNVASSCEEIADDGKKNLKNVTNSVSKIKDGNEHLSNQLSANNEKLSEIANVINTIADKTNIINDIVFQTKLLSFNASVEAARAGEHGKGFSVVAEEIGNLASMSGEAANEIKVVVDESVSKVQEIVIDSKDKVTDLIKNVTGAAEVTDQSVHSCTITFNEVVEKINLLNKSIHNIEMASKEQSLGVSEVSDAINSLNTTTQKNSLITSQGLEVAEALGLKMNNVDNTLIELLKEVLGNEKDLDFGVTEFEWTDDLLLEVSKMDSEHKIIFENINTTIRALNNNNQMEIENAFNELASFTVKHFAHEEEYMQSIDYPGFEGHRKIHEKLIESVMKYGEQIKDRTIDKKKFTSFLKNWLVSHIMGVDVQYANHAHQSNSIKKVA